jgi:lycopene elongase/hydratase (dihydrobisanhydrobacterioruberin-forming)
VVIDERPTNTFVRRVNEMVALSRPSVWITSLLPFCLGYVLATRQFLPHSCTPFTADCVGDIRPLVTGVVVIGPLFWLATLAINDAFDLQGDLNNPRKAGSPLTSGRLSPRTATWVAYAAASVTLLVAATVDLSTAALLFALLMLGWAYSVPPLRLKSRPGWDVAVNAVSMGALAMLAGWSVVRPIGEFPWVMVVEGLLVGCAIYLPTTLADYDADVEVGYTTVGVRLGHRLTHYIGLAMFAAACAIAIFLSAIDHVFPRQMLPVQVLAAPILLGTYHAVLGRARTQPEVVRGLVLLMSMFTALNIVFAVMYVGWI